jgi:DNA (cytosine-5)-methyltransferase 1
MKASSAIRQKIARLAAGGRPRVLDLFSGCGGLSLGFQAAGFEIAAAVEFDPMAAASHGINFHPTDRRHWLARDITATPPEQLARDLDLGPTASAIDVIVGGPPCQAFARVGRAKLREIEEHPEAYRLDPRARLFLDYLRYVDRFEPLAILVENVPDVLNHGGVNIAEEMAEALEAKGYIARYTLLNAVNYGVPQMRERMFLIAVHGDLRIEPTFPIPTHHWNLPSGYEGTRAVALKTIRGRLFNVQTRYVDPPGAAAATRRAVSAQEAIGDLPPITMHLEGRLRRGARRFLRDDVPYDPSRPISGYAAEMKGWPSFEARAGMSDHVIRYLPRDWKLFARMRCGSEYPELHRLAVTMFEEKLSSLRARNAAPQANSPEWKRLRAEYVPPYDANKFPNKWWKLVPDGPVRTLMAHLGKDSYSHIHFDSAQARTISVREAARLQSFPDGFRFEGTMNPAFRQIGNAVPPLLAKALAAGMLDAMRGTLVNGREVAAVG